MLCHLSTEQELPCLNWIWSRVAPILCAAPGLYYYSVFMGGGEGEGQSYSPTATHIILEIDQQAPSYLFIVPQLAAPLYIM